MKRGRAEFLSLPALLEEPLSELRRLSGSGSDQVSPLVALLRGAGLHAQPQSHPPGVAVYLRPPPAATIWTEQMPEHALLCFMCGLAAHQDELEGEWSMTLRRPLLAKRFAARLRKLRPRAELNTALEAVDAAATTLDDATPTTAECATPDAEAEADVDAQLEQIIREAITAAAPVMAASELQLEREWLTLVAAHSSLANAALARFCELTNVRFQDASLVVPADPSRARISLLLYDSTIHAAQQRPRAFSLVPCLRTLLATPDAQMVAQSMAAALWRELCAAPPPSCY